MKGRVYLIIGVVLGGVCGWALGFLRLPLIVKNDSFWVGLLAGICLASLILVVKSSFGRKVADTASVTKRGWIGAIAIFLVSGGLLVTALIDRESDEYFVQLMQKKGEFVQEQALIQAKQQANLGLVMESLFAEIQEEITTQNGRLSSETIGEIVRISQSFEPYRYYPDVSLETPELSPERGQLLLFLIASKMDTNSFQQVISKATFAGADLEGADLAKLDLSGIDLMGANLKDAILNDINLSEADLRGANLWGAQLQKADLTGVDMRRADVRWAELTETSLRYAHLDGADFSNALMGGVDLYDAKFQYGNMSGAMLSGAMLSCADFELTTMDNTDCSSSNLTMTNLKRVSVQGANFSGAELSGVTVEEENWIEKLKERQVFGEKEIQASYQIADDSIVRYANSKFILVPVNQEDNSVQN